MSLLKSLGLGPLPPQAGRPPPVGVVAAAKPADRAAELARLSGAAEAWRKTHATAAERILALKKSVLAHYKEGQPELLQEIEKGLTRLDQILAKLDHRLADSLARAAAAAEEGPRRTELTNAKTLLAEYIDYVNGEPLIAHIDDNPFGAKPDLRALLAAGLKDAGKVIA